MPENTMTAMANAFANAKKLVKPAPANGDERLPLPDVGSLGSAATTAMLKMAIQLPGSAIAMMPAIGPLAQFADGAATLGESRVGPLLRALGDRSLADLPAIMQSVPAEFLVQVAILECQANASACLPKTICPGCGGEMTPMDQDTYAAFNVASIRAILELPGDRIIADNMIPKGTLLHALALTVGSRPLNVIDELLAEQPLPTITKLLFALKQTANISVVQPDLMTCHNCGFVEPGKPGL